MFGVFLPFRQLVGVRIGVVTVKVNGPGGARHEDFACLHICNPEQKVWTDQTHPSAEEVLVVVPTVQVDDVNGKCHVDPVAHDIEVFLIDDAVRVVGINEEGISSEPVVGEGVVGDDVPGAYVAPVALAEGIVVRRRLYGNRILIAHHFGYAFKWYARRVGLVASEVLLVEIYGIGLFFGLCNQVMEGTKNDGKNKKDAERGHILGLEKGNTTNGNSGIGK